MYSAHSLSIVIHPLTPLGQALLAILDPAEMVVLAVDDIENQSRCEKRYPWFSLARTWLRPISLPDTRGPIRIYLCCIQPQSGADSAPNTRTVLRCLAAVNKILPSCGRHPVHVVLASSALAAHPLPHSMTSLTIENELERLCRSRPDTLLSVLHAGRLVDRRTGSQSHPLFATSFTHLARLMIQTAAGTAEHRMVVGIDARIMSWYRAMQQAVYKRQCECARTQA